MNVLLGANMRVAVIGVFLLLASLAGCANPNTSPLPTRYGDSDVLVTGAALRLTTERSRYLPTTGEVLPTFCSEPSPDVAIAFGRTLAAQGSFSEPSGPTVSGSVNAASTETATALAGRTAGVLALRDGLYAACQSYANGVIGHDAYALILSQYGNLLVALAGTGQSSAPAVTAKDAAISALIVACISEWDPTRLGSSKYSNNPLLNLNECRNVLAGIRSGQLFKTASAKPQVKEKPKPKTGKLTGTVVTAKTVSTFSAPEK
jgi:hypothetical protein